MYYNCISSIQQNYSAKQSHEIRCKWLNADISGHSEAYWMHKMSDSAKISARTEIGAKQF